MALTVADPSFTYLPGLDSTVQSHFFVLSEDLGVYTQHFCALTGRPDHLNRPC